jgi:EAL domain-containing protein (putative c-di-GMP-specific phosphodiesterase class I)
MELTETVSMQDAKSPLLRC